MLAPSRRYGQRHDPREQLARMLAETSASKSVSTPLGALDKALGMGAAGFMNGQIQADDMAREESKRDTLARALQAGAGTPAATGPGDENMLGTDIPAIAGDRDKMAAILAGNPDTADMGLTMTMGNMDRQQDRADKRSWYDMTRGDTLADTESLRAYGDARDERNFGQQERMARLNADLQAGNRTPQTITTAEGIFTLNRDGTRGNRLGASATAQEPLEKVIGDTGQPTLMPRSKAAGMTPYDARAGSGGAVIGEDEAGNPIYGPAHKPMPPTALKMQQEELDAIGAASSIRADMKSVRNMIGNKELKLGPVENLMSRGKDTLGMSDQNSRNFKSFQAALERMRNESLRLNKGVQTEGDSVRAWNELIGNINDPDKVMQRLEEIDAMNERAANFRRMNVDAIRKNYGLASMDTSGYENVEAAIGKAGKPSGGWSIEEVK